jgi:dTMP kinase
MPNQISKPRFVSFEGIEGVGKTTQVKRAAAYLHSRGYSVVETREPGGTRVGELIRDLVLGVEHPPMASETELLLMFAARTEHLARVIRPALAAGQIVLCDRFTDASFAYQGGGRNIPEERIAALEAYVHGGFTPDLTLLLDAPVTVGLERAKKRGQADRFDAEAYAFFEAVRACYLDRARRFPERFRTIDAGRSVEHTECAVRRHLDELLSA